VSEGSTREERLRAYSKEDFSLYSRVTSGLATLGGFRGDGKDKYGNPIPFGWGPHCVKFARRVLGVTKPSRILEIGLNLGYSSAIWLDLSNAVVVSVDISDKDETLHAARTLFNRHPGRFEFICCDSREVEPKLVGWNFDMIFIDGDHTEPLVSNDIQLGLNLGVPWFVFDDYMPIYGPGTQPAIKKHGLELVEVLENIAIARLGTPL